MKMIWVYSFVLAFLCSDFHPLILCTLKCVKENLREEYGWSNKGILLAPFPLGGTVVT